MLETSLGVVHTGYITVPLVEIHRYSEVIHQRVATLGRLHFDGVDEPARGEQVEGGIAVADLLLTVIRRRAASFPGRSHALT